MTESERLNGELNKILGRLVNQHEQDHEAYLRERETLALMVVTMERHLEALQLVVEQMKSRIAGITPTGRPPQ